MYRKALALRQKLLGPEHVDIARSEYQLADLLMRKGEYEAAEPFFRRALAMQRKLLVTTPSRWPRAWKVWPGT